MLEELTANKKTEEVAEDVKEIKGEVASSSEYCLDEDGPALSLSSPICV